MAATRRQHFEGPRERLAHRGAGSLSDAELVAILCGTGTTREPVEVLAVRLLDRAGGLAGLERATVAELSQLAGVGPGKASRLVAAIELGRRALGTPIRRGEALGSSEAVDRALRPRLARAPVERFIALGLDARNRPIAEFVVSKGGRSSCPVEPADVFRELVRVSASAVIFVHNHPSGEPSPSLDDARLTERLRAAGVLLGVRVLDHVIIADRGYFSFRDAGLLGDEAPRTDEGARAMA
ncbi:MAG: DNA repair protein RadC [Myxococcales bacterium]|nr:DNA repair protein RadC [Myxococcales bacterium]